MKEKTLEDFKTELAIEKGYISWSDINWYLEDQNCQSEYPLYAQEKYLNRCIENYVNHVKAIAFEEGLRAQKIKCANEALILKESTSGFKASMKSHTYDAVCNDIMITLSVDSNSILNCENAANPYTK